MYSKYEHETVSPDLNKGRCTYYECFSHVSIGECAPKLEDRQAELFTETAEKIALRDTKNDDDLQEMIPQRLHPHYEELKALKRNGGPSTFFDHFVGISRNSGEDCILIGYCTDGYDYVVAVWSVHKYRSWFPFNE